MVFHCLKNLIGWNFLKNGISFRIWLVTPSSMYWSFEMKSVIWFLSLATLTKPFLLKTTVPALFSGGFLFSLNIILEFLSLTCSRGRNIWPRFWICLSKYATCSVALGSFYAIFLFPKSETWVVCDWGPTDSWACLSRGLRAGPVVADSR